MDTEVLVDNRIEDGQKLLTELVITGFDVSVAFWVKTSEDLWFLYIGSTSIAPSRIGDAYRTMYACLTRIPDVSVGTSEVMLIQASDPIAKDAIVARDRQSGRLPVRLHDKRLGSVSAEEAYIYPRIGGQMMPKEILQTLIGLANRPAGAPSRPSTFTLRNGATINALITGFNLQLPGGITIHTLDPASNVTGQIPGDEVVGIRL